MRSVGVEPPFHRQRLRPSFTSGRHHTSGGAGRSEELHSGLRVFKLLRTHSVKRRWVTSWSSQRYSCVRVAVAFVRAPRTSARGKSPRKAPREREGGVIIHMLSPLFRRSPRLCSLGTATATSMTDVVPPCRSCRCLSPVSVNLQPRLANSLFPFGEMVERVNTDL